MTCTEFLAILDDVIDESVAAQTRAEIESHLKTCGHCEVVLNTVRKTIEIYQCHELYELPADVSSRLHSAIKSRCVKVR
ncbi:MAG: zf-HC2 domain-containing protein [Terracidiphilus sp.]